MALMRTLVNGISLRSRLICCSCRRFSSAIDTSTKVDKLFIQGNVQEKLKKLTGYDDGIIFAQRPIESHEAPRYMFMTPEDLEMSQERASKRGKKFIEMVPYLSPVEEKIDILRIDPELQGYESNKFVFTDISHGANDKNRLIVVREPNGILRRANRSERYRMSQVYFPVEERSHLSPKMFEEEHLKAVLERNEYTFILERTCLQFEPDDYNFVRITHSVYETINEKSHFDTLWSSRFFGPMVFHLVIKKNIDNLLLWYLKSGNIEHSKELIELYNIVHCIKDDGQDFDLIERYIQTGSKSHVLMTTLKSLQEQQNKLSAKSS